MTVEELEKNIIVPMDQKEIKCVVWDLDETLWHGVLTEDTGVELKPGIVEILETLDKKGILLSIASKNNFEDAMARLKAFNIDRFFLYPEINWGPKSESIGQIQKHLNFAIDTFLFIDDQAFERDEVRSVHQQVLTVDALDYEGLPELDCCNPRFITEDSNRRRRMYMDDISRKVEEESFNGPSEAFLASLKMEFVISKAKEDDLKRAEELTVRTNQLNATGKTYDYDELSHFRKSEDHLLLVCELTDRYGSYGKIGLALIEKSASTWHLKLLLMSCRVMSRGVGTVLMSYILQEAKKAGVRFLADFKKTDRNRMMYVSYKFANFTEIETDEDGFIVFENDLSVIQKFPPYITIEV